MSEAGRIATRRAAIERRAAIQRALRGWFEREGFLEVETPLRVPSPGQEVHLDAFPAGGGRHLITSPEYHMKRLVAAGLSPIVQFARCFRAEERGPHHEPEFTMIEWYRAGAPLERIADDCEALVRLAAAVVGSDDRVPVPPSRAPGGVPGRLRLDLPFERVTVREVMRQHAGVDLVGNESADELRGKIRAAGHPTGTAEAWDDLFFQLFLDRVEGHLGRERPTFLFDWPLPLAALARPHPNRPGVAERFELYAGGLELANAFGELIDPVEQRRRFEEELALRRHRGKAVYPIDEKLLTALGRMPPTSGVALGFDRLVMLVLGADSLAETIPFADDEV